MPGNLAGSFTAAEAVILALAVALLVFLALVGIRRWKNSRISPEERERRRREKLVILGKMGDATLVEVRDDLLFYTYGVRGIEYTASQDVTGLKQHIPQDLSSLGVVSIKYDPKNPANSIVVAEDWSGLHYRRSAG
ncbi:MAG TPA: hypothetical protein VLY04_01625 [Bryobacteraceae bacterium]|nr:hypothetical protein [Bryobacteraceae bacterium]